MKQLVTKGLACAVVGMALTLTSMTPAIAAPRRPVVETVRTGPAKAKKIAKKMVAKRGWSKRQYSCLVNLWNRESGWRTTAGRAGGSYGIPQANPGGKMASAGKKWRTDATTQIRWGLSYIAGRYKTPCGAWSHFQMSHWY